MSFSQRMGLKAVRDMIQLERMDAPLRSALWDCLHLCIWSEFENRIDYRSVEHSNLRMLVYQLWHRFFHLPIDSSPSSMREVIEYVRKYYFSSRWNECYDLIEFCAACAPEDMSKALASMTNHVLEEHLSGYRLIEGQIAPITSEDEISSIESAIDNPALNSGARAHLRSALEKLSDRAAPDHRNSIKESISAVEAACQQITGDPSATLGQALKPLEDKGLIHPALKSALSKLYGYTSDSGGIRHAMLEESTLAFTDSKFMLVACTAFVNYLVDKSRSGITG
ncbi:hypothetical protein EX530_20200 [Xanthomonas phaseoli]|uniref:AbiJ-NTD4 domain-containing protein n=1 Tax=Xanthomonas phaseoli TaxID=1985254 RepID=UPI003B00F239